MRICALIPVFNNAETIEDVVRRCRTVIEPDILVVSDGSTDGSEKVAKQAGADVLILPRNMGKGAAIRRGMKVAFDRGYTHAIVLDADGQHLPEDIPRLYEAIWNKPDRLWIGVRRMDPKSTPTRSRRGRTITNFWTTVNTWQRCRDAQCGFRAYPIKETLDLNCSEPGFQFELEVLIRAAWANIRFAHIGIDVVYQGGDKRISHFDPKRDNWRFTWLCFRFFWGMLLRAPMLLYRKFLTA